MGCVCRTSRSKFEVANFISIKTISKKTNSRFDYLNSINKKDWINILDFLSHAEIKEIAKVNK